MQRPGPSAATLLLSLGHQRRVEARVVVHLELPVHLEMRSTGLRVGDQRIEATAEIGALLQQALQLAAKQRKPMPALCMT